MLQDASANAIDETLGRLSIATGASGDSDAEMLIAQIFRLEAW
jgi:hypothetical protein